MRGKLNDEGNYELFRTTKGNHILNLKDKDFYALVEGQLGDIIVLSDADHKKQKTISSGKFYFVDFKDDPEFSDMPHLFMENGNKYKEFVLPEGFPTKKDKRRKLVRTKDEVPKHKVMEHVKGEGNKGTEKKYSDKPEGLRAKTKEELYELAQKHDLKNRSKMSKEELVENLKDKV